MSSKVHQKKPSGTFAPKEMTSDDAESHNEFANTSFKPQLPSQSTYSADAPIWYQHYTLSNIPPPPSAYEQQTWVRSADFKKQQKSSSKPDYASIGTLKSIAANTLSKLIQKQAENKKNRITTSWAQRMLANGAINDKISALFIQVKYQPLSAVQYLDSLLALAAKKGTRETNTAVEALADLFTDDLLPKTRKLRFFHQQPWIVSYLNSIENPRDCPIPQTHPYRQSPPPETLAYMYLEDQIKTKYAKFIEIIEDTLQTSNFAHTKRHRLQIAINLLQKAPEQEDLLMMTLIGKFGDSDRTIISRVTYLLDTMLKSNPGMKLALIKELERLIFRPHIKQRTQYFAILFLTNLEFKRHNVTDQVLCQNLLSLYLTVFQVTVTEALPTIQDKKLATQALLTQKEQLIKHGKGKKAAFWQKKAKRLTKHQDSALSTKILSALLAGVSRCLPYAVRVGVPQNELSESEQQVSKILSMHVEQLLHVAASTAESNGNVCVQSFALLWQVLSLTELQQGQNKSEQEQQEDDDHSNPLVQSKTTFYRCLYSVLLHSSPFTCSRVKIFFNIFFKAVKHDTNQTRVVSMIKRFLQTSITLSNSLAAAALYLVSNLIPAQPILTKMLAQSETSQEVLKQDLITEQQYNTYQAEHEAGNTVFPYEIIDAQLATAEQLGDVETQGVVYYQVTKRYIRFYDAMEGDPSFTHSTKTGLFEILQDCAHYHPTLSIWAQQIFRGEAIEYSGDPLKDFTTLSFLESWIRKQPKKVSDKFVGGVHTPQRLIVDPEQPGNALLLAANSQFMTKYQPSAAVLQKAKYRNETEDQFAERLMEEELLRIGGHREIIQSEHNDKEIFGDQLKESLAAQLDALSDDDNEDDDEEFDMLSDAENIDVNAVDSELDEVDDEEDLFIPDEEIELEEDDDDDDDVDTDAHVLLTAPGVFDDEEDVSKRAKKTTAATAKSKKNVQKDIFADMGDISDIELDESDDDADDDLRNAIADDDTIVELLEASHAEDKDAAHVEKLLTTGLAGKKRKQDSSSSAKNQKNTFKSNPNKKARKN